MSDSITTFIHALVDAMADPGKSPELPPTPTTDDVLVAMLTQNCGTHPMDSGGSGGRAWQRNQGMTVADFKAAPVGTWRWHAYDYNGEHHVSTCTTISVFHFLRERIEFDPEMHARWVAWRNANDEHYWSCNATESFVEERGGRKPFFMRDFSDNSYNNENVLSQDVQFTVWLEEDAEGEDMLYMLLSIHGGADIRGGYSDAFAFKLGPSDSDYWSDFFEYARLTINCDGCHAWWDSSNAGYTMDDQSEDACDFPKDEPLHGTEGVKGKLVFTDGEDRPLCPCCGEGRLNLYPSIVSG